MSKIDKIDLENISLLKKELKLKNIKTVKIKKGDYEIEISSDLKDSEKTISQLISSKEASSSSERKQTNEIKPENVIKSPMVGVAYLSPEPSASAYIKEGQHVKQGDILLLIEAMKTFNEIKAPKSGVIKKNNCFK